VARKCFGAFSKKGNGGKARVGKRGDAPHLAAGKKNTQPFATQCKNDEKTSYIKSREREKAREGKGRTPTLVKKKAKQVREGKKKEGGVTRG